MDLDAAPAIVADMDGEIGGALAYRLIEGGLHIVALATDPMWQRSGVGGYLVAEAELMARRLQIPRVIVPEAPGLFSALGLLWADLRADFVATARRNVDAANAPSLQAQLDQLEGEATAWLEQRRSINSLMPEELRFSNATTPSGVTPRVAW